MTEKRLTFSQDVITQQNDKENVSDLASCLERTIVSPNTYLRARGPPQYGETPLTPGAPAPREAPASRWTPAARRASGASSVGDDNDDDDEAMDDDEDAADSGDDGEAIGGGVRGVSRKSVEWASRQQRLIDAAAREPKAAIKILKPPNPLSPGASTPEVPRYVTSYAETPLSGESRCSDWVPRSRSDRGDWDHSDDDDDDERGDDSFR